MTAPVPQTDKQADREAELKQRREDLEQELESYARAGVVSPTMLRGAKWFSRALYMAMAALVVFLMFSGWGKHSQGTVDELQSSRDAWKKRADDFKAEKNLLEEKVGSLIVDAARADAARRDAEAATRGGAAADAAQGRARLLVSRVWGEQAYNRHWREILARAEPHAHGDPKSGAIAMIEQAVTAPANQRFELMRELADFGAEGVGAAARGLLISDNIGARPLAALALARLGRAEDLALMDKVAAQTEDPAAAREIWFAGSLLSLESDAPSPAANDVAEYWLRFALRSFESRQALLADHYRSAAESARLDLLALLCECAGPDQEDLMRSVASSDRATGERMLAVRWLAQRRLATDLLKTLAGGTGPVAEEAKKGTGS
ncbi:MAG: hypothetical protein KF754_03570 [Planctomycetes bacterium]|nr:hypothetical protein [Planctomycetota bacterium]